MTDDIEMQYVSLRDSCLNNPYFLALMDSVEADIKEGCSIGPEQAVQAFYELSALRRIKDKLQSVAVNHASLAYYEQQDKE